MKNNEISYKIPPNLAFMIKYDKLAADGNIKKANIKRFAEIGLDKNKLKIHLSLDRYYFLTQVSDAVDYYIDYLRLHEKDNLDFYKTGYYQDEKYITQFGRYKVKIPDNIIANFTQAKISIVKENKLI